MESLLRVRNIGVMATFSKFSAILFDIHETGSSITN